MALSPAYLNGSPLDRLPNHHMAAPYPSPHPTFTYERGSAWGRLATTFDGTDRPSSAFASKWGRLVTNNVLNAFSLYLIYTALSYCLKGLFSLSILPLLPLSPYLAALVLLIGLYSTLNIVCGCLVHPASLIRPERRCDRVSTFRNSGADITKRISIRVNGSLIDVVVAGKRAHTHTGRYIIFSQGNGAVYEGGHSISCLKLAEHLQAIALFFNYPGTGDSEGFPPQRETVCASYDAVHKLLQDEALFPTPGGREKVIYDFGVSIGGGIQGVAIPSTGQNSGRRVFIKYQTFSSLSKCARHHLSRLHSWLITLLRWEYAPLHSTKPLQGRDQEIIIQKGKDISSHTPMHALSDLDNTDGIIKKEASLAHALFPSHDGRDNNRQFLLTPNYHCFLNDMPGLVAIIAPPSGGNDEPIPS